MSNSLFYFFTSIQCVYILYLFIPSTPHHFSIPMSLLLVNMMLVMQTKENDNFILNILPVLPCVLPYMFMMFLERKIKSEFSSGPLYIKPTRYYVCILLILLQACLIFAYVYYYFIKQMSSPILPLVFVLFNMILLNLFGYAYIALYKTQQLRTDDKPIAEYEQDENIDIDSSVIDLLSEHNKEIEQLKIKKEIALKELELEEKELELEEKESKISKKKRRRKKRNIEQTFKNDVNNSFDDLNSDSKELKNQNEIKKLQKEINDLENKLES